LWCFDVSRKIFAFHVSVTYTLPYAMAMSAQTPPSGKTYPAMSATVAGLNARSSVGVEKVRSTAQDADYDACMNVDGDALRLQSIATHLDRLACDIGPRPVGSTANARTVSYIADVIDRSSLVSVPFESRIEHISPDDWHCAVDSKDVPILPGAGSPAVHATGAHVEPFVYETENHFRERPPSPGSVAVVSLGTLHESRACALAGDAAAVAWFRTGHPGLYSGNCKRAGEDPTAAGFAVDEATATAWVAQPTQVDVRVWSSRKELTLRSIVCDVGTGSGPRPVFVAHHDSKPMTEGANDNASGVAVLLTMLQTWGERAPARFVFFDGEEIGVRGADAYVEFLERAGALTDVASVICVDSVGLGELHLYTADKHGAFPQWILDRARAAFTRAEWRVPERAARSGGSDFWPFHKRGIPCVFLSDFPNATRHTTADTRDTVDVGVLDRLAGVLADADWMR
jgi:hypothetical protein